MVGLVDEPQKKAHSSIPEHRCLKDKMLVDHRVVEFAATILKLGIIITKLLQNCTISVWLPSLLKYFPHKYSVGPHIALDGDEVVMHQNLNRNPFHWERQGFPILC